MQGCLKQLASSERNNSVIEKVVQGSLDVVSWERFCPYVVRPVTL